MAYLFAFFISKIVYFILKITGHNATVYPGRVAIKICPNFLEFVKKPDVIIGVTGTNGKTTVSNMISDILRSLGYRVLANKEGANVNFGIASTFIGAKGKYDIAVLEIDERSSKLIYPYIKPEFIIVTNLFRDSIRRNAHPEFILDIINSSIPDSSILILNADDLISSRVGNNNSKVFFGMDKLENDKTISNNIVRDIVVCPKCLTKLKYEYVKYHHIGKAYCPKCDFKSAQSDFFATDIDFNKMKMTIRNKNKAYIYPLISNSVFNIYNEIAVITLLTLMKIHPNKIKESMKDIKIVETRFTNEKFGDINVITHLAKGQNPIACSRVFEYVRNESGNKEVIIIIDDIVDNTESSENITWIYDCDFEFLKDESIKKIIFGGKRANDNYLRVLLAGISEDKVAYTLEEVDTVKYLSFKGIDKIFILHDLHATDIGFEVKERIKGILLDGID